MSIQKRGKNRYQITYKGYWSKLYLSREEAEADYQNFLDQISKGEIESPLYIRQVMVGKNQRWCIFRGGYRLKVARSKKEAEAILSGKDIKNQKSPSAYVSHHKGAKKWVVVTWHPETKEKGSVGVYETKEQAEKAADDYRHGKIKEKKKFKSEKSISISTSHEPKKSKTGVKYIYCDSQTVPYKIVYKGKYGGRYSSLEDAKKALLAFIEKIDDKKE